MQEVLRGLELNNFSSAEPVAIKKLIDYVVKNGPFAKRSQRFSHFLMIVSSSLHNTADEILSHHLHFASDLAALRAKSNLKMETLTFPAESSFADTTKQSLFHALLKETFYLDVLRHCLQRREFCVARIDFNILLHISHAVLLIQPPSTILPDAANQLCQLQQKFLQLFNILIDLGKELILFHTREMLSTIHSVLKNTSHWYIGVHRTFRPSLIKLRLQCYKCIGHAIHSGLPGNDATLTDVFKSMDFDLSCLASLNNKKVCSLILSIFLEICHAVIVCYHENIHSVTSRKSLSLTLSVDSELTHAYGRLNLWHKFMLIVDTILQNPLMLSDSALKSLTESLLLSAHIHSCLPFLLSDCSVAYPFMHAVRSKCSDFSLPKNLFEWPMEEIVMDAPQVIFSSDPLVEIRESHSEIQPLTPTAAKHELGDKNELVSPKRRKTVKEVDVVIITPESNDELLPSKVSKSANPEAKKSNAMPALESAATSDFKVPAVEEDKKESMDCVCVQYSDSALDNLFADFNAC